jgi:hypothetical protein
MPKRRWAIAAAGALGLVGLVAPGAGAATAPVTWRTTKVTAPGGGELIAISCPTASFCMAVGTTVASSGRSTAGPSRPLVETWDGTAWTVRHAVTPAGTTRTQLSGVSCPSATDCTVVGATGQGNIASVPLAEVWNGKTRTWRVEPTVNPSTRSVNEMFAVSCPATSTCVAVGSQEGGTNQPLREIWHSGGSGWKAMSGASTKTPSGLFSVSCPTATSCVAGGEVVAGGSAAQPEATGAVSLVQTWSGAAWKVTRTGTTRPATATSASCSSPSSCAVIGTSGVSAAAGFSLILSSGHWRVATYPSGQVGAGVACLTGSECLSVGAIPGGARAATALYRAGAWKAVAAPALPAGETRGLTAVSCPTATRCVAIGGSFSGSSVTSVAAVAKLSS